MSFEVVPSISIPFIFGQFLNFGLEGAIPAEAYPQCPILLYFRPSGPSKNGRWGDLESKALIGIEFGEFRRKLKNFEFR